MSHDFSASTSSALSSALVSNISALRRTGYSLLRAHSPPAVLRRLGCSRLSEGAQRVDRGVKLLLRCPDGTLRQKSLRSLPERGSTSLEPAPNSNPSARFRESPLPRSLLLKSSPPFSLRLNPTN